MGNKIRIALLMVVAAVVSFWAIGEPAIQEGRRKTVEIEPAIVRAARVIEGCKPSLKGVSKIGFVAEKPVNTLAPGAVEARLYFTQRVLAPVLVVPLTLKNEGDNQPEWVLVSLSPGQDGALPGLLERYGLVLEKELAPRRVLAKRVAR